MDVEYGNGFVFTFNTCMAHKQQQPNGNKEFLD